MSSTVHSGAAPLFDISRVTVSGTVHSGAAPLFDISTVTVSGTVHSGAAGGNSVIQQGNSVWYCPQWGCPII